MQNNRLPNRLLNIIQEEKHPGRPQSRWKLQDAETGPNGHNPRSQKKKIVITQLMKIDIFKYLQISKYFSYIKTRTISAQTHDI
jgi:hypothetical protein